MLKLFGATLVIVASTIAGFQIARDYQNRPLELRLLQRGLKMLETEIVYGSVPLYHAMEKIGTRLPGGIGLFFTTMSRNLITFDGASTYECWSLSIEKNFSQTSLKKEDKELLLQFGHTLGSTDKEDQIKHIQLTVDGLLTEEQLARDEQMKYERLSKNLGVLLGILVVILMY